MDGVGSRVEYQVIGSGNLRQAAKHAAEQGGQMPHIRGRVGLFKEMTVLPPDQPYFKGHARSVRTKRDVIALGIDDAPALLFLLPENVAENTSFLVFEPGHRGAQLVKNAPRHKRCR